MILSSACGGSRPPLDDEQGPFDIAFLRDGFVFGVRADGTGEQLLIPDLVSGRGCPLQWSPDGSMLAIDLGDELVLLDPGGEPVAHALSPPLPSFSPDGTRVALLRDAELVVQAIDGSTLLALPIDAEWLAWSPESSRLALRRAEPPTIVIVNADDGRVLQEQPGPPTCRYGCQGPAVWGEAGIVMATASVAESEPGGQDLALVDPNTGGWRALEAVEDKYIEMQPNWSDRRTLAFGLHGVDDLSWSGHSVVVSDLTEHMVLGPAMTFDWAPDGEAIVAESSPNPDSIYALGQPHALILFGLDGAVRVLVDDPDASETCPSWRAEGPNG